MLAHRQLQLHVRTTHAVVWIVCSALCAKAQDEGSGTGTGQTEKEEEEGDDTKTTLFGLFAILLIAFTYAWRMLRRRRMQLIRQRSRSSSSFSQGSRLRLGLDEEENELPQPQPAAETISLEVAVPEGLNPGEGFCLPYNGQTVQVTIPESIPENRLITVQIPALSRASTEPAAQLLPAAAPTQSTLSSQPSSLQEAGEMVTRTLEDLGERILSVEDSRKLCLYLPVGGLAWLVALTCLLVFVPRA